MKVIRGYSTDPKRSVVDPLLEKNWDFFFELRGGDVLDPLTVAGLGGTWFGPKYPWAYIHFFVKWPILPFFAWRFKNRHGYLGWKCYGVDSPHYLKWMKPEYVYDGSQALHFSVRPGARVKD